MVEFYEERTADKTIKQMATRDFAAEYRPLQEFQRIERRRAIRQALL